MATAPDPAPVKQMETLLECSVCMETLTQPRTLSCYHSFCKHCLENYVAAQREKAVEAKAKVPEIFECPLCRTEFSVKEEENIGEKMPANHFINNLLELLSIQQQAHHVKCQSCKSNAPAASRCISCEKYLCQKCLQTHNKWPDFEDHIVLTLEELAKPENRAKVKGKSRCEKHDKILKFYCETCKVLVCRYCMELNHTRPEHTWFPLTDVVVQHKEALKAFSGIFEKQKNDAAESNRKIADAMATLKNNATKARDAIKQQQQNILNAFTKKLEKETTALLDQVEMKYRNANEPLLKQQANVKAYFEKAKSSLDITSNILSSGSDEVLLALKREIEEKAGSIVNERPEFMEPIHDGFLEYHPKRTKDIMKNLKLNDLGKIVNPVQQSLSEISTILEGNIEHAKQLVEWMKDTKFGWHLCYRASRDGWEGGDFHRNCDDVGPTLTLVKCGTNIFGGFTDQSWNHRETNHDYYPIETVAKQHKKSLETTSANLQRSSNEVKAALQKIDQAAKNLQFNTKRAKDTILQQEKEILQKLTQKVKHNTTILLAEVDRANNIVNQQLGQQRNEMKAYHEKVNGSLDFAKNIIEKASNEEIILLSPEIQINAKDIKKESPEMMEPIHDGSMKYQADSSDTIVGKIKLEKPGNFVAPDEVQLYVRSTILDGNTEHAKQLVEWMEDTKFGLQLCYRASRDGWEADDFHRKCDDVGPTLTLVKCGTNIFGGFTDQSWKHTGHMEFKRSNSSFLFSLKNKENMRPFRCPIKDGENNRAICCHRNCGAAFGGYDLYISSNANRNKNSFSNLGHTYQPPPGYEPGAPRTNALLAGSYEFTPSEIEVFHS